MRTLRATVVLLNDPPDSPDLAQALRAVSDLVGVAVDIETTEPVGPVRSVDDILESARVAKRDVLLLSTETAPSLGALTEMMAVAHLDPLTAMVGPGQTAAATPQATRHLPRQSFVPGLMGPSVFIRHAMLAEFGTLDRDYTSLFYALQDLLRRCNQRGYRAVLANRAQLSEPAHAAQAGNALSQADQVRIMARYPEYRRVCEIYRSSADHWARHVGGGLAEIDKRPRLLFDCRILGAFYNGTFEHIGALLTAFARTFSNRYEIHVLCDEHAFRFHRFDDLPALRRCDLDEALRVPAAIALRMNQPDRDGAASLARLGAVTGALMLDTIALDCQQLDAGLEVLWQSAASTLDMIGFNSDFSRDQFGRRFAVPHDTIRFVSRCSTTPSDYAATPPHTAEGGGGEGGGGGILLVGNDYPHKHLQTMLRELLAAGTKQPIVCFGMRSDEPGVAASYASGDLSPAEVKRLYAEPDLVIFPSHYEGFGLPIMHALAQHVPVIARNLPNAREIRERTPLGCNLHLFDLTAEMVARAQDPPRWIENPRSYVVTEDWTAASRMMAPICSTVASPTQRRGCSNSRPASGCHVGAQICFMLVLPMPRHGRGNEKHAW